MMFNMMKYYYLLIKEKEKGKLEKINSKYILKIILENLENKKLLYIIKYNKKIKKRIGININNYKKYSEKYSSIEIEIKQINNKYMVKILILMIKINYIIIYILMITKKK